MTALTFPGQVPFTDPSVPAGGCAFGLERCTRAPELEVVLPATNDQRCLCREHAGWYMLAAATSTRYTGVRVRQLGAAEVVQRERTVTFR